MPHVQERSVYAESLGENFCANHTPRILTGKIQFVRGREMMEACGRCSRPSNISRLRRSSVGEEWGLQRVEEVEEFFIVVISSN